MHVTAIENVIKEKNIVVFAPHFDDSIFMTGNYFLEMQENELLQSKNIEIALLFARSNYLAGTGQSNFDTSLDRQKLATGKRILEDMSCLDELLGAFAYQYRVFGEKECFVRGKSPADSEMEFPHGMYDDFNEDDWAIMDRMECRINRYTQMEDTALVFPIAFKEHIDHFITREAGLKVAKALGEKAKAKFYFQEDKPYGGIADENEQSRIKKFVKDNPLEKIVYRAHPENLLILAFKHYISQVEEVYKTGIRNRSQMLQVEYALDCPCDQMYLYHAE